MDLIGGLQRAVDYTEAHLTEKLDYAQIAKQAYSSSFHFQRVFGMLCGYTLGEYIRNRRLTLAGSELAAGNCRVLDIALKYGYDSPESFARAFLKFHGVTPSQAKARSASLKAFSPLRVKLILEGGFVMDYRIEKRDALELAVYKKQFAHEEPEAGFPVDQVCALWADCGRNGVIQGLCGCMDPAGPVRGMLGVCLSAEMREDFDYALAVVKNAAPLPAGLETETLPAATWAVFPCKGPMPEAFSWTYKQIYGEFFPTSSYQPTGMCLEVYPDANVNAADFACEIWLSVEAK